MAVPETSVHKNGNAVLRKHEVRPSRQVFGVNPETQADPMGNTARQKFGRRVL
jgi:hypothetical protein